MRLELRTYPDPVLKETAEDVTDFDHELLVLVENMYETMYHHKGIGLAAPQVGILKRLFIMDLNVNGQWIREVFINPHIQVYSEDIDLYPEGCLSLPGHTQLIRRANSVVLAFKGVNGKDYSIPCNGYHAACVQHEIDHLDGKILFDYPL